MAARPGIGSLAELRGRRVGLTLSTLGPYVLSRALEQAGLSLDDVEVRTMTLAAIGGSALWLQWRQGRQLSVSITSWPANEYLYLAEQKQLGKPFGIDLRVTQSSSLADQRLGFVNGDVDVMATTLPEAIAVCQEAPARCPQLVLVLDESVGADRLLARVGLARPAALAGQRVGLERTVLAEYLLLRSLEGQPVAIDDLQLRFEGPVALIELLRAGEIDAVVTYPPYDLSLRQDDRFHELFSSRRMPGEVVDVLAVAPETARTRRSDIQALVRTWWAAQAYARRHRTEAVGLMAQRQQISPGEFQQSELGLRYPEPGQQRRLLAADGPVARAIGGMGALLRTAGRIPPDGPLPRPTTAFLAASNVALVGLPLPHVLQLPHQRHLRELFAECPSTSTLIACLTRDEVVFQGPLSWIGGDVLMTIRQYPLALEGGGRYGERASLITITDVQAARTEALTFVLKVFLAGLLPLSAGCVGLMFQLRRVLIPELLQLAQIDALSGIYNRRAFSEAVEELLSRARQTEQPMAMALIDVDFFKQINDTHGHDAGDQVIRQVSELLRAAVRGSDLVGRLGGDEFAILVQLPGDGATLMLERTRERINATAIATGDGQQVLVNLSVGVASTAGPAGYGLSELMGAADAALYVAKDRGRGQVVNLETEGQGAARRGSASFGYWQVGGL